MPASRLKEFDLHILSLLRKGPSYGYELLQYCKAGEWEPGQKPTPSRIYYSLQKLEREGLTRTRTRASEKAPDQVIHSLTPAGRRLLDHELSHRIRELRSLSAELFERYRITQEGLTRAYRLMHRHADGSQSHI
jgi:DNA-binding PadR family transcriptional regulator